MDYKLSGKRILVTGASRGIGFGIAQTLSQLDCIVTINGRDAANLAKAKHKVKNSYALLADVSKPSEAARLVEEAENLMGGLDAVVCNVGNGRSVAPGLEKYDEWQKVFGANLWSTTNVVEASQPALIKTQGAIICISSICGIEVIPNAPVTYSVAKSALNFYINAISRPLGAKGIRINGVAPGNIMFEGSVWEQKIKQNQSEVEAMLADDVPLKRLGTVDDVAKCVAFLISQEASFATGTTLVVDGGQVRQ